MAKKIAHIFGTDPEVFVYSDLVQTAYGNLPEIIPPAALVEDYGMKMNLINEKKVLISGNGFQWSEDGAAIEMQIDPQESIRGFFQTVNRGINTLTQTLTPYGLKVWSNPLGYFNLEKYWKNRGEEFQMCVIFGCDPDEFPMKYYELGLENSDHTKQLDVSTHEFRYGGAHIHIQAPESNPTIYFDNWDIAAICFDFFAGMLNTTLKKKEEIKVYERARLQYYGKPGRIRLQIYDAENEVYGIEYRVMSNHWINNFPKTRSLLFTLDLAATVVENDGMKFVEHIEYLIPEMYKALINSDADIAGQLYKKAIAWSLENGFINMDDLSHLNIVMERSLF
jgi:hypothetical protein